MKYLLWFAFIFNVLCVFPNIAIIAHGEPEIRNFIMPFVNGTCAAVMYYMASTWDEVMS